MNNQIATISFTAYSSIYLLLLLFERNEIAIYLKPGLEPFLIYIVYAFHNFPTKKILLSALIVSWLGDLILMYDPNSKTTFLMGLGVFFITHIIYTFLFNKQPITEKFKFSFVFLLGIAVVSIHLIVLLLLLLPNLQYLKIPVIVYALSLSMMLISALKGSLHWNNNFNLHVLLGAFIFAFSDSINAINLFYIEIPNAFFWQELCYLLAQFLITIGILSLNQQKPATSYFENSGFYN